MKHYLPYIQRTIHLSLLTRLAYPKDYLWGIFSMPLIILGNIASIYFVLRLNHSMIVGTTFPQIVFVSSFGSIIGSSVGMLPITGLIGQQISTGNIDSFLLKPRSTFVLLLFQSFHLQKILFVLTNASVCLFLLLQGYVTIPLHAIAATIVVSISTFLLYGALYSIIETLSFYSPHQQFFHVLLGELFLLKTYPIQIYPVILQMIGTWILPIFLITNPLFSVLAGTYNMQMLFTTSAMCVLWCTAAWLLWCVGIKRYESVR